MFFHIDITKTSKTPRRRKRLSFKEKILLLWNNKDPDFYDLFFQRAKSLKQKKEEGNAAFKACNWSSAHELYSQALEIDPCNKATNAKLYFNRATVAAKVRLCFI